MDFYMRNYIEGLFLSSAIIKNPDYTCELLIKTLKILREEKGFRGYIHVKAIPGADEKLIEELGFLADRMSVNVELPSRESLKLLAPDKDPFDLYKPTKQITTVKKEQEFLPAVRRGPSFVPAGQSTQMIIGASPESDRSIVKISENLYQKYQLKRVYYSAYIPVNQDNLLPAVTTEPPLLREHRLYQADWLLRFYKFTADEILSEDKPNFNLYLDPKYYRLHLTDLKKLGIVIKRAQYFIACNHETPAGLIKDPEWIITSLISSKQYEVLKKHNTQSTSEQLSLFDVERFEHAKSR